MKQLIYQIYWRVHNAIDRTIYWIKTGEKLPF